MENFSAVFSVQYSLSLNLKNINTELIERFNLSNSVIINRMSSRVISSILAQYYSVKFLPYF